MTPQFKFFCWSAAAAACAVALVALGGCASVKPYLVCKVADGHAQVQQGVMGVGVGQELPDADPLCGRTPAATKTVGGLGSGMWGIEL